ncbi:lipase family protein [Paenibacillus rigui]|uniref:Lipase n=1 Tax=Paenibacillus rigui TaxID=554312 RepID=A0A229UGF7_9BACL|nr:lipase family protein [Paenibacillus rigui]OXM82435.1 lipase [Paenibacillus rigui]
MDRQLVIRRAIFLSAASYQAMKRYKSRSGFVLPQGYTLLSTLGSGEDSWFGCIMGSDKRIVVAFRGTENSSEMMRGLDFTQVVFPYGKTGGRTHRGYMELYRDTIRTPLLKSLRKFWTSGRSLWVTGHSLGGAMATLSAVDIAANSKFKQPLVYTFGSPKVGDPVFAAAFDRTIEHSVRVVNTNDLVPQLPPSMEGSIYSHVKGLVEITIHRSNVFSNHHILQYHRKLAELDPSYAEAMCGTHPGFCSLDKKA